MPLTRAINHPHSTASDLLQNLVIANPPMRVPHFVFGEDRFERFTGCLAITLKSLPQRAAQAKPIAQPRSRAALPALGRAFTHARHGIGQAPRTFHSMVQTLDLVHNSLQAKLPRGRKSDAETHRTPKHFVRNAKKCDPISRKLATGRVRPAGGLSECERVPASLLFFTSLPQHPRPASRTDAEFRLLHRSDFRRSARLPRG